MCGLKLINIGSRVARVFILVPEFILALVPELPERRDLPRIGPRVAREERLATYLAIPYWSQSCQRGETCHVPSYTYISERNIVQYE